MAAVDLESDIVKKGDGPGAKTRFHTPKWRDVIPR